MLQPTPSRGSLLLRGAIAGVALCAASCSDDDAPVSRSRIPTVARYAPSEGVVPIPNDLLFSGSVDATLNLPVEDPTNGADPFNALNSLDGWSTLAPISVDFSRPLDPDTVIDPLTMLPTDAVRVFEVTTFVSPTAPVGGPVITADVELVAGVDFRVMQSSATSLAIQPLRPLTPSTLASNSVYMVVVTNTLRDTAGFRVGKDTEYIFASELTPYQPPTPASLIQLQGLVNSQLNAFEQFEIANSVTPLTRDDVVVSFTFTTQSVGAGLDTILAIANGQESALIAGLCSQLGTCMDTTDNPFSVPTARVNNAALPLGTASELVGGPVGNALIYAGILEAPYYLTAPMNPSVDPNTVVVDDAPLTESWSARYAPAGATDSHVTRFNFLPNATSAQKMPMLVMVPDTAPPPGGFPVVIFQHGIGQNRTNLLGVAESLAAAGLAAVAIDLPLHGVSAVTGQLVGANIFAGYRQNGADVWERTFGLDLLDESGLVPAAGPDGNADSSGVHFLNLTDLAVSRDNNQQAVADLINLRASIGQILIMGVDVFDETDVHFMGHSLGGIVGTPFISTQPALSSSVIGMAGGSIPYLLNGSTIFGPTIRGGLAAAGVLEGTPEFDQFLAAAQTVLDTVDPINHAASAVASGQPVLMLEIVGGGPQGGVADLVVPNDVMDAPFAGTEPLAAAMALAGLSVTTTDANGLQRIVRFVEGDHSSLVSPGASAGTMAAFAEMQTMVAGFHATAGTNITVTNTAVVQ